MDTLGKLVRAARKKRGHSIATMAKAIKCSEAFARHIESSPKVPISPRLINAVCIRYGLPAGRLRRAAGRRHEVGRAYYRKYNQKRAKAAKRAS